MLGVFFMEFSIYFVYFSACHVNWLILIVICPTAPWVFQESAPEIGGPQANTANLGIELRIRLEAVGSWQAFRPMWSPSRRDIRRTETSPASTVPTSTAGSSATKELLSETTCSCTKKILLELKWQRHKLLEASSPASF